MLYITPSIFLYLYFYLSSFHPPGPHLPPARPSSSDARRHVKLLLYEPRTTYPRTNAKSSQALPLTTTQPGSSLPAHDLFAAKKQNRQTTALPFQSSLSTRQLLSTQYQGVIVCVDTNKSDN